jgi:hypothetical protein
MMVPRRNQGGPRRTAGLAVVIVGLALLALLHATSGGLHAQETDAPAGGPKTAAPPRVAPIRTVAFSPDGKSLAAGGGPKNGAGQVTLWDIATQKPAWQESLPRGVY